MSVVEPDLGNLVLRGQEEAHVLCCGGGYNKNQLSSHFFLGFGLFVIENSSIVNEAGLGDGCVIPLHSAPGRADCSFGRSKFTI